MSIFLLHVTDSRMFCIVSNGGGRNFSKFGELEAIHHSFAHPNLHFKENLDKFDYDNGYCKCRHHDHRLDMVI